MSDQNPPSLTLLAVFKGEDHAIAFLDPDLRTKLSKENGARGQGNGPAVLEQLVDFEAGRLAKPDDEPVADDSASNRYPDAGQLLELNASLGQPYISLDPPLIYQPTRDRAGRVDGLAVYRGQPAPDPAGLQALYVEVCRAHDAISDFRAKLLAALPVLSGAGLALLLKKNGPFDEWSLIPIGLFGALITLGLLVHELRGLVVCHILRGRGAQLEQALQLPANRPPGFLAGEFDGIKPHNTLRQALPWADRTQRGGIIGAVTACWIVYGTVLVTWLFVAAYGFSRIT
jgi:hypothetical protein